MPDNDNTKQKTIRRTLPMVRCPCFAPFHVLLALPLRVLRKKSSGLKESLEAMAGGHHGNGITYGGLTLHTTKGWHSRVGKGMCAMMWFWILYRAKQDGAVVLGWRHPWDHPHGHGHAESHEKVH
ncbi:unnamed protein product [Sphagnum tenellum]